MNILYDTPIVTQKQAKNTQTPNEEKGEKRKETM
jgi:hypothetical protein